MHSTLCIWLRACRVVLLGVTRNTTPWELRMTYELPWIKGEQRQLKFHLLELLVKEGSKETSLKWYYSTLFTRKMGKDLFVCQIHVNDIIFDSSNASFVKSLARVWPIGLRCLWWENSSTFLFSNQAIEGWHVYKPNQAHSWWWWRRRWRRWRWWIEHLEDLPNIFLVLNDKEGERSIKSFKA
jgi:hypothetical protein